MNAFDLLLINDFLIPELESGRNLDYLEKNEKAWKALGFLFRIPELYERYPNVYHHIDRRKWLTKKNISFAIKTWLYLQYKSNKQFKNISSLFSTLFDVLKQLDYVSNSYFINYGDIMLSIIFMPSQHQKEIRKYITAVLKTPTELIQELTIPNLQLDTLPLKTSNGEKSLSQILETFSGTHPDLLPNKILPTLWDRVQSMPSVLGLLNGWLKHLPKFYLNGLPQIPKNSTELLCEITGLHVSHTPYIQNLKNPNQLFEMLLDMQSRYKAPIFHNLEINSNLFESSQTKHFFLNFLEALRRIELFENTKRRRTYRTPHSSFQEITSKYKLDQTEINLQNIENITSFLKKEFIKKLPDLFDNNEINFSHDKWKKLEEKLGNLDAVFTLLSRLSGEKGEQFFIVKSLEAILKDEFEKYKFDDYRDYQLGSLNDQQFNAWKKKRVFLSLIDVEKKVIKNEFNDRKDQVKKYIQNKLLPQTQKITQKLEEKNKSEKTLSKELLEPLILEHIHQPKAPKEILQQYFAEKGFSETKSKSFTTQLFKGLVQLLQTEGINNSLFLKGLQKVIKLYLFEMRKGDLFDEIKPFIELFIESLKEIDNIFQAVNSEHVSDGFIVSVVDHSPKLLMTTGNLVKNCASCLNYKTGVLIEYLPSYVIDGNIQIMLSFHLKEKDFYIRRDYLTVLKSYINDNLSVSFNGNSRVFTFKTKEGEFATRPIEYAVLRQMLKIGFEEKTSRPGVFLESAYNQYHSSHIIDQISRNNHKELLLEIIHDMKALNESSRIIMAPSRNPLGAYSEIVWEGKVDIAPIKLYEEPVN